MPITFIEDKKIFKLDTCSTSYIFCVEDGNFLVSLYYGKKLPDVNFTGYIFRDYFVSFNPNSQDVKDRYFSPDLAPLEYSGFGTGDFRKSAAAIRNKDGNNATDFRYVSHEIRPGKPKLKGLPATYAEEEEATTLYVTTEDKTTGARAILQYTVFENLPVMTRSVLLENASDAAMDVEKVYSASVSLPDMDFDFLHLYGNWAVERHLERTPLAHGHQSISSTRGSSSHHHNPFAALVRHGADEDHGDVYGFNLVYSSNFDITADCDFYECTRINMGINPDGFTWHLNPGETFQTPEAVMVYTDEGIGEMSRIFHRLYREHLIRGKWKTEKRPLLINSWEAAFFDFDTEKLVSFAAQAKELGFEMLVMDDGWFGNRFAEVNSLGDWYVNENKLVGGIGELIRRVKALGMKFGMWYEPEMISPDSNLYRAHPDWCIHVPNRTNSIARTQYVIDMTRQDVRDNIFSQICSVLDNYDVDYIKWDFNRNITEAGSALLDTEHGKEVFHRFVLGTYELMDRLLTRFPNLLLENCSGGGGRFDPGTLFFSPQIWTSDNTDALQRLPIQFGTSYCYPASAMGAHVSLPHSMDELVTKGNVALWGTFGYELDPGKLAEEYKEVVKKQVEEYNLTYDLIHYGDLYRIISPFENGYHCAWSFVSPDKSAMYFTHVCMRYYPVMKRIIRMKGLDENKMYRCRETGEVYSGALLMNAGINVSKFPREAGQSFTLYFTEEK